MTSNTSVYLNFSAVNSAVTVYAKQNDRLTRKIKAYLFDGSTAWVPPAGSAAIIRYRKPDGTAGFYDTEEEGNSAAVISGNTVTITLAEQALTVPGDVLMEINFYGGTGASEKLTSFYFLLKVQRSVLDDATIISSDYFNVLTQQVSIAQEAAAEAARIAADLPQPSGTTPLADVAGGAVGSGPGFAYGDHRHPMPTAAQVGALALAGNQYLVNPVDDLSNYATGFALFNNATERPVASFPYDRSVTQWALVISGKADAGTAFQLAYNLVGGTSPRFRYCAGGTWSAWADVT